MIEVYLKTPGIVFSKLNGSNVRSPVKFLINNNEEQLYRNLLKVSSITDYEFNKTEERPKSVKNQKLSMIKPRGSDINLNLKIQG